jgi:hypothetical protein
MFEWRTEQNLSKWCPSSSLLVQRPNTLVILQWGCLQYCEGPYTTCFFHDNERGDERDRIMRWEEEEKEADGVMVLAELRTDGQELNLDVSQ